MSGSTLGGLVGGVIGFWVGGPTGAQWGFMLGSAVGSSFDTNHIQGPKLGDIPVQTSQEGAPRPIPYGTPPPFPGNLIQAGPKLRIPVEEEQGGGKGGPTTVVHTEKILQTYAIRICEGPATVLKIWRDGKLAVDFTGQGVIDPDTYMLLSKIALYAGDESQMPDASLESLPAENGGGIGNVPAYRGTCYMVVTNDDLTNTGGRIPNYEFLVSSSATIETNCAEAGLIAWWPLDDASPGGVAREVIQGLDGIYTNTAGPCTIETRPPLNISATSSTYFGPDDVMTATDTEVLTMTDSLQGWTTTVWYSIGAEHSDHNVILGIGYTNDFDGRFGWGNGLTAFSPGDEYLTAFGGYNNSNNHLAQMTGFVGVGSIYFQATVFDPEADEIRLYLNGSLVGTHDNAGASGPPVSRVQIGGAGGGLVGQVQDLKLYNTALTADQIRTLFLSSDQTFEIPDAPGTYVKIDGTMVTTCVPTATIGDVTLAYALTDIADRCDIPASQMDVVEAEETLIDGFLIGHQMPGNAAQSPLCLGYFGDLPEFDGQLHWVPRGAPIAVTITDDDMLDDDEVRELSLRQKIELPRRVRIRYSDAGANYAPLIATSERESINVSSTGDSVMELPMVLERDVAFQKSDILLKVITEESLGTIKFRLPFYRYAQLVPSDRFAYDGKEWRINKLEVADGILSVEAVRDRQSNYISAISGNEVLDPTAPVSSAKGPSILQALNLPRLRTEDNQPGMYLAVTGLLPAWPGADIYLSTDGGVTEAFRITMTRRATMGVVTEDITASADPISLTVYDNRTLSSITDEQMLARQNGFAVTTDGTSEIKQFQNAVETDDNIWEVSDVVHGLLDTDDVPHDANDQFVLLDTALAFLPIDIAHAGKTLIFRAVTRGTPRENNNTISVVYDPQFTGPAEIEYLLDEDGSDSLDEAGTVLLEE